MTRTCCLSPLLLLAASCAHLPSLSPLPEDATAATTARCQQVFPRQPWHATHTIFATLPFGQNSELLGVTATSPEGLHAVLLSPEGLTLFDGVQRRQGAAGPPLVVKRAVPPFDQPAFAASLMADVGSAFLAPPGAPLAVGRYASGDSVCRWSPLANETTDVVLGVAGTKMVLTFRNLHLVRQVALVGSGDDGFFTEVSLTVPGAGGYTLEMRLVDRE